MTPQEINRVRYEAVRDTVHYQGVYWKDIDWDGPVHEYKKEYCDSVVACL